MKNLFGSTGKKIIIIAVLYVVTLLAVSYFAMLLWNACLVFAVGFVYQVSWMQMTGIIVLIQLIRECLIFEVEL